MPSSIPSSIQHSQVPTRQGQVNTGSLQKPGGPRRRQAASPGTPLHPRLAVKRSESRSVVSDSGRFHGLHSPWDPPGRNTRVGSLSLLQGSFRTQEWNWGLLHCRRILYQPSHQGLAGPCLACRSWSLFRSRCLLARWSWGVPVFSRSRGYTPLTQCPELALDGPESSPLLVLFGRSVVSGSLQPRGLQPARPPHPSPNPGVCRRSCPSNPLPTAVSSSGSCPGPSLAPEQKAQTCSTTERAESEHTVPVPGDQL